MKANNSLKYISTRGQAKHLQFKDVIFEGLASDGGLYVPDAWPKLSDKLISEFSFMSYQEIAYHVFRPYIDYNLSDDILRKIIEKSYKSFSSDEITPLRLVNDKEYLLELFHGPTYAFKDIAMQFISNLFDYYLELDGDHINILGATSGDTGSAAIYGFKSIKSANVFILHPYNMISSTQRKFMTTINSDNIINIAVRGNFDDCQKIIKEIFSDEKYKKNNKLGAINSINWARIMCQITYYFYSASRLPKSEQENIVYSVPTGNFGDIFAGYISKKMGLNFKKLIISTNENDILHRTLQSGHHELRTVVSTSSPSIDIQISSNFERLIYDACKDSNHVNTLMSELKHNKTYILSDDIINYIKQSFTSCTAYQDEVVNIIRHYYSTYNITLDPHTAVGVACGHKTINHDEVLVTLSTAHPAKFKETVSEIISNDLFITDRVKEIESLKENMLIVDNNIKDVKSIIDRTVK